MHELVLTLLLLLIGVGLVVGRRRRPARFVVAGAMGLVVLAGALPKKNVHTIDGSDGSPRVAPDDRYVSSSACKSCHPGEYASWHRTFHRTMTQRADASLVQGALDATLRLDGLEYDLQRRGDEVWATLPDPEATAAGPREPGAPPDAPRIERRLLLATGSHHYQGYWFAGHREGELRMFPFVYLFADRRWMPRRDVFLRPPDAPREPRAVELQLHPVPRDGGAPGA